MASGMVEMLAYPAAPRYQCFLGAKVVLRAREAIAESRKRRASGSVLPIGHGKQNSKALVPTSGFLILVRICARV